MLVLVDVVEVATEGLLRLSVHIWAEEDSKCKWIWQKAVRGMVIWLGSWWLRSMRKPTKAGGGDRNGQRVETERRVGVDSSRVNGEDFSTVEPGRRASTHCFPSGQLGKGQYETRRTREEKEEISSDS